MYVKSLSSVNTWTLTDSSIVWEWTLCSIRIFQESNTSLWACQLVFEMMHPGFVVSLLWIALKQIALRLIWSPLKGFVCPLYSLHFLQVMKCVFPSTGARNAVTTWPTGTMRRMASCTAVNTTGRSLESCVTAVLCSWLDLPWWVTPLHPPHLTVSRHWDYGLSFPHTSISQSDCDPGASAHLVLAITVWKQEEPWLPFRLAQDPEYQVL